MPRVTLGVDAENRPARRISTSASACTSTQENVVYEKAARVSLLRARCPDCSTLTAVAIGPRVRVPLVRPDVRRRARARAARVGRRRRADDRGGVAFRSTIRRRRSSRRTRSHAQTLAVASDLPARPLVLGGCCCSHIGAVEGLAAPPRAARRHLVRRARRPEHARDLAVGQRVGDAAADADRRRRGRPRRTSPSSARATSIRPRSSSSRRPGSTTTRTRCSTASTASTSRSTATSSSRRAGGLHAGARQARPSPRSRSFSAASATAASLVGCGLTGLAPDPANVEKLERLTAALGF